MTALALDIAIGVVILLSTAAAAYRGFVREVFTLVGLAAAVYASYKFGHLLVPEFSQWLHVPAEDSGEKTKLILGVLSPALAAKVFSHGAAFLVVWLVMVLTGFLLSRWVKETGLGIVDRVMGAAFGFLRGYLLVFLIYLPCTYLIDQEKFPAWAKESHSLPVLQSTLAWLNKTFELDKKIEDRGDDGIAIKLDKIDPARLSDDVRRQAEKELKEALEREAHEKMGEPPEEEPAQEEAAPPPEAAEPPASP